MVRRKHENLEKIGSEAMPYWLGGLILSERQTIKAENWERRSLRHI